jgi:hypothetical protein
MASSKIDPGLASPDIPAKLNPPASPPWQSNITDIRRRHPKTPIVEPSSTLDSIVVDTGPPSSPSTRVKFAEPTPSIDRPNRPGKKITFAGYDSTNTRTQIHPNHRRPSSTPKTPRHSLKQSQRSRKLGGHESHRYLLWIRPLNEKDLNRPNLLNDRKCVSISRLEGRAVYWLLTRIRRRI